MASPTHSAESSSTPSDASSQSRDCELELNYESSDFDVEGSSVDGGIRPYQFEPEFNDDSHSDSAEENDVGDALGDRLNTTECTIPQHASLALENRNAHLPRITVDAVKKLQATLRYKTDARIDDTIRKLDRQLRTQNFKMAEEKRIVSEIDALKRSKKVLREFLEKQSEIDIIRETRTELKANRDFYFKSVFTIRSQEESIKKELNRMKREEDETWAKYKESGQLRETLKKEIDKLFEKKREIISTYKQQQNEYFEWSKTEKHKSYLKREEERRFVQETKQKEIDEYKATRLPYEDDKLLISTLLNYLHRNVNLEDSNANVSAADSSDESSQRSVTSIGDEVKETDGDFHILRKKSADDMTEMYSGFSGKRKKSSNKKKRNSWLNKPLKHSPEIFTQFSQLGLTAPATVGEMSAIIEALTKKKEQFDDLSTQPRPKRVLSMVEEEKLKSAFPVESGQFDDAIEPDEMADFPELVPGNAPQMETSQVKWGRNYDNNCNSLSDEPSEVTLVEAVLDNLVGQINSLDIDDTNVNNVADVSQDNSNLQGSRNTKAPQDDNSSSRNSSQHNVHEINNMDGIKDSYDSIVNFSNLDNDVRDVVSVISKERCTDFQDNLHPCDFVVQDSI
ncbi:uncharacterized protein LOC100376219 [Saccoglossus kowalevskii]|uniref:Nuclear segregation protein BFR1-like n=1 Tax=Saccoglossus kowalevskii TaxID=10224 RepID=A0ABM0GSG6_SACKO|nr:PREDICTED: nuclear segregation protein BFR1-like [Saccoglossus kowalevskii]